MSSKKELFEGSNETSSEDENSAEDGDGDADTTSDISTQFAKQYPVSEIAISLSKSYVLNLSSNKQFTKVAAGASNNIVQVFDIADNRLTRTTEYEVGSPNNKKESICGVQFSKDNPNDLFIGTCDGSIHHYDLRKNQRISTFKECTLENVPITCFDTNSNGRMICAGSEKFVKNVYLLFFDIRQRKSVGGYCESNNEDVTDVKFHPTYPDLLMSGSTDGLINIFDISKSNEYDALSVVINTESSVQKLQWHTNDRISCITHTDLKFFESEEGDLISEFLRPDVTNSIKRKSVEDCNLVNCHDANDGSTFLLAGSNYNKGETLRSVTIDKGILKPLVDYEGNKQIIRSSVYNPTANILITGGEGGIITLWSDTILNSSTSEVLKIKSKTSVKGRNKNPY